MMARTTCINNKPPLGTLIAVRLKDVGKTQKWLSEDAQVSQIYLCAVLAGRANPTLKFLKKLAKSLDINIKDLTNALLNEG